MSLAYIQMLMILLPPADEAGSSAGQKQNVSEAPQQLSISVRHCPAEHCMDAFAHLQDEGATRSPVKLCQQQCLCSAGTVGGYSCPACTGQADASAQKPLWVSCACAQQAWEDSCAAKRPHHAEPHQGASAGTDVKVVKQCS